MIKDGWSAAAVPYRSTKDESMAALPVIQQWLSLGMRYYTRTQSPCTHYSKAKRAYDYNVRNYSSHTTITAHTQSQRAQRQRAHSARTYYCAHMQPQCTRATIARPQLQRTHTTAAPANSTRAVAMHTHTTTKRAVCTYTHIAHTIIIITLSSYYYL